jgi:uncharacterized protein (DUF2141 family)
MQTAKAFLGVLLVYVMAQGLQAQEKNGEAAKPAGDLSLKVMLTGVANTNGFLHILVFRGEDGFPSDHKLAVGIKKLKPTVGKMEHTFTGLAPGEYGISVLHDENENDLMDKKPLGFPKEGYGLSMNPVVRLKATWDKCVFAFKESGSHEIKMVYP